MSNISLVFNMIFLNFDKAKKKIMFVSCNPTDPVWNPPTQNFL